MGPLLRMVALTMGAAERHGPVFMSLMVGREGNASLSSGSEGAVRMSVVEGCTLGPGK